MTDNSDLVGQHFVDSRGRSFEITAADGALVHYRSLDERRSEGAILASLVRPNLRLH